MDCYFLMTVLGSKNIKSILKICELNTQTCPIVKNIFERLKQNDYELLRK